MNFFEHQDQARAASRRMLVLFVLAVIAVVVAVDVVLIVAAGLTDKKAGALAVQPGVLAAASLITLSVIGGASMFKIALLRGGGGTVARQLGATPVPAQTTNFAWKRLRNVVEEIAIASGVPVPEIFVLEREEGINAFAAGYTPADAAVTVTQGALNKLTRDELQGVIAHEFSHILNGDMRLNIRLMGVVFGILVIGIAGRKILENAGGRNSKNSGGVLAFGLALLVIGYVGMFCGRLIKASISRSREYLADASAVQFTRQSLGIAGALKKIGALAEGSKLARSETEEVAHMLFGDGVGYSALMATHPPVVERIRRLEPRFDPRELEDLARAWSAPRHSDDPESPEASIAGFVPALAAGGVGRPSHSAPLPAATASVRLNAGAVASQVGNPASDDYRAANTIAHDISASLREAAQDSQRAIPLVFALAMDGEAGLRAAQLEQLGRFYDAVVRDQVEALVGELATLHPMQRLPLAALAFPVLRRRPRPELQRFLIALNRLVQADGRVGLPEYCLVKLIGVQVMDALDPSRARVAGSRKLPQCAAELIALFAVVAEYGHDDRTAAERAFRLGLGEVLPNAPAAYAPPAEWSLALDRALPVLDQLQPAGKELVVRGLTRAISEDGRVAVAEAELLRVVCAALHCPLPPLLQQS